jgi:hypothetical protein
MGEAQEKMVEDLRRVLRYAKIEGSKNTVIITLDNRAERMNLIGHLANLCDGVI